VLGTALALLAVAALSALAAALLSRRSAARRAQSGERFRILFDRSPHGILVVNAADHRVLRANDGCEDVFGRRAEDLVGQPLPVPEAGDLVSRAAAHGTSDGLARVSRPDGSFLPVGFNATVFPWSTPAVLVTLRDASERVQADEERARLEATLRNAATEWVRTFDAISAGILLVDADGCVRRLNEAARAMSGRPTFAELLGRPLRELGEGEPWTTAAAVVDQPGAAKLRQALDEASGRSWAVGRSTLARPNARPPWTVVTLEETTLLVAMQDALRRSESMAALGALVAAVAHEVRSPLFAISSTVEVMEDEMQSPAQRERARILRESVARLNRLMEDLLDYGRPAVEARVVARLETAVHAAIRECEQLARTAGVTVSSRSEGVLPALAMDQRGIVRAFQNVVQNAIQHSAPGGQVEVELRAAAGWSVCTVRDHGRGFEPDDLPRYFTPFFSRRPGGSGLGLALVRRVVEEHGGQVFAHNHPEGGAVVTIRLPDVPPPGGPR
jgi:PAS domain S-box-containing protein